MAHKFIVGVNSSSSEFENNFVKYLNEKGHGWWHWIDNFWLIDSSGEISASDLRDAVKELSKNENIIVFEIFNSTWSGYGPKNKKEDMFDWIRKNW